MDLKKAYYYVICLVALFVFFWGLVDLTGAAVGLTIARPSATIEQTGAPEGDQSLDAYYQKKILFDRLSDGLARVIVAGLVFAYCRSKVSKLQS
jgi:hypothetical protein